MNAFLEGCYSRSRDVGLIATIVIIASMIAIAVLFIAIGDCRADDRAGRSHGGSNHCATDSNRSADNGGGQA